jgi:serine/threonine protein kinase/Tfp pilus assembly protein PilF
MNRERWGQVKNLFAEAIERPAEERDQFLREACGSDEALEDYLHSLLAAHSSEMGFLDQPPLPLTELLRSRNAAPNTFQPGDVAAGRFQIRAFLGRGGMGEVYEAFDSELQEPVALKTIRYEVASDPRLVECFKHEVTRARQIVSAHVCRVYDLFRHRRDSGEEVVFLTMELLRGENLADVLRDRGKLGTTEALPIIRELGEGLAAAHRAGIVHRDFKSSNVMLVPHAGSLRAVITDFGLARQTLEGDAHQQIDTDPFDGGGTPAYMAPEQVEGRPVTFATDIYSLGVVSYEMVTGRKPFEGETAMAVASKRLTEPPRRPRDIVPDLDPRWESAILRCLEREPRKRFASATDLTKAVAGETTRQNERPRFWRLVWAIAMLALTISVAALLLRSGNAGSAKDPPHYALAVLPFENLDRELDSQYYADGITEELINAFTKVREFRVISRASSFRFKGSSLAIRDIAKQLGVRYILTGGVQREGGRLRIRTQLLDSLNSFPPWSRVFYRDEREAFAFTPQTVQAVAATLGVRIGSAPGPDQTPDAAAHNDYLLGLFFLNKRTDDGIGKAHEHFRKAAAEDPNYPAIHIGLAETYRLMAERGMLSPVQAHPKAKEAALRALSLDSTLADTYVSLGNITSANDRDIRAGEKYYLQALALNPNLVTAHQSYSYMLMLLRRFDESLQHARRAAEIDPLSNPANSNLAILFFYMRDFQAMTQQCRKMLELDAHHPLAHMLIAQESARNGDGSGAYAELEAINDRPKDHPLTLRTHAEISAILGNLDLSEQDLQILVRKKRDGGIVPSSYIAIVSASLGRKDRAFEWLEKAYEEHDRFLSVLHVYPAFDNLRSDPRYASLLRRIGIMETAESDSAQTP